MEKRFLCLTQNSKTTAQQSVINILLLAISWLGSFRSTKREDTCRQGEAPTVLAVLGPQAAMARGETGRLRGLQL
jgi:hypothetical protein